MTNLPVIKQVWIFYLVQIEGFLWFFAPLGQQYILVKVNVGMLTCVHFLMSNLALIGKSW